MPADSGHVLLLGDSIFDNARYVPGEPAVIEQVRDRLPTGWRVTLLAIDGDVTTGVARQLTRLPADATHLFVSVGGNDALGESGFLNRRASSVPEVLNELHALQSGFRANYRSMLRTVLSLGLPTAVCTIYDSIPGFPQAALTALGAFNEVILREAIRNGLAVIDLRIAFNMPGDYSSLSPIEPSVLGGAKIACAIADVVAAHDFARPRTTIYF